MVIVGHISVNWASSRKSYLRSTLSISKLENVVEAEDGSKAELKGKKYLKELVFKWTTATTTDHVYEVLNKLQPHENLK